MGCQTYGNPTWNYVVLYADCSKVATDTTAGTDEEGTGTAATGTAGTAGGGGGRGVVGRYLLGGR